VAGNRGGRGLKISENHLLTVGKNISLSDLTFTAGADLTPSMAVPFVIENFFYRLFLSAAY